MRRPTVEDIKDEVCVTTSRSGGPGGQHVNKVETKVTLRWTIGASRVLGPLQQELFRTANKSKVTKEDEVIVTADGKRSQLRNKEIALKKLDRLLAKAFHRRKPRIATKPSKATKMRRLQSKKKHSEKKELRRKIDRP